MKFKSTITDILLSGIFAIAVAACNSENIKMQTNASQLSKYVRVPTTESKTIWKLEEWPKSASTTADFLPKKVEQVVLNATISDPNTELTLPELRSLPASKLPELLVLDEFKDDFKNKQFKFLDAENVKKLSSSTIPPTFGYVYFGSSSYSVVMVWGNSPISDEIQK